MKDNLSGLMKKKTGGYIFMGKVKLLFRFPSRLEFEIIFASGD
jgi:hypothetical protein